MVGTCGSSSTDLAISHLEIAAHLGRVSVGLGLG